MKRIYASLCAIAVVIVAIFATAHSDGVTLTCCVEWLQGFTGHLDGLALASVGAGGVKETIEATVKAIREKYGLEPLPDASDPPAGDGTMIPVEQVEVMIEAASKKASDEALKKFQENTPEGFSTTATPAKFANIWKYDNVDEGSLALGIAVADAAAKGGYLKGSRSEDATKALAIRLAEMKDEDRQFVHARQAMKQANMPFKANELNQSTLASYGDEWVGQAYSSQMWDAIRQEAVVAPKIPTLEVPQGAESVVIPLESTPPTFYKVAQASAQGANPGATTNTVPTSKLGTANQTITVGKLGAGTTWTGELTEDSIVAFAEELRRSIQQEGAEVLDHIIIDGDTSTTVSTNINDIAGTPAGTEAFLLFNGFRHLALVTNTANARSAATFAIEDFLETVKLMGTAGMNAMDMTKVSFIVDLNTYWKSWTLTELKSQDYRPGQAIVKDGILQRIYGYELLRTASMHRAQSLRKAQTDGKIDLDNANDNTTGSILSVRWDQWRLGWKRRMTIEVERVPRADAFELTALMRVGMIHRDNEAAALSYNVTL